jgi:hypothetical protein
MTAAEEFYDDNEWFSKKPAHAIFEELTTNMGHRWLSLKM